MLQLGQAQGRPGLGTQQYAGVNGLGRPGTGLGGAVGLSPTLAQQQQQQQQQQQLRQAGGGGMGGLTGKPMSAWRCCGGSWKQI